MQARWPRRSCRCSSATIAAPHWALPPGFTRSPPSPPSRLPDDTPTSIAPPSRARRNKLLLTVAKIVVAAVVLWFVGKGVAEQVAKFRSQPLVVEPRWSLVLVAALFTLSAF